MSHKHHYTYKVLRQDGKYYIGVHSTNNLDDGYLGSGKILKRSIRKHGADYHALEILAFHKSRKDALLAESVLVTKETLNDPQCMNIIVGGGGPGDTSKIGASLKGRPQPKSVCEAISKRRKGVPTWGRPVVINGTTYASAAEAARATGLSDRTVTSRCRRQSLGWRFADQEITRIDKKHPKAKSVIVDGVKFDTVGEVEKLFGICRRTIKLRCESSNFPTWSYGID